MNDEQTRTRFATLLLPLMKDAYNLSRWLMKNQEDAEDMVQESYLRAYRFFGSFHEGTNCRAWFLRIVRNSWFDGKLKFSPPVHDFAERGFRLTGGRLDYLNGREVAALVYQRRLHVINLFIWPSASGQNTAAESFSKDGYNVSQWVRGGFEFWAVSDVNAEDLRTFAGLEMQPS
jgi:hypothetical protein